MKPFSMEIVALSSTLLSLSLQSASCFVLQKTSISSVSSLKHMERITTKHLVGHSMSAQEESPVDAPVATEGTAADQKDEAEDSSLFIPLSFDEMVRQSSSAMKDAYNQGITRQIIRILLPRGADNDQILTYFEDDVKSNMANAVLVPPDETWQGGIMQLYRAASLTCQEILRRYSSNAAGGVPPKLMEDRSVDESGVDGIGLWITQGATPEDDVSCFVQPCQETVNMIEGISKQAGNRLVTLVNPQWRITDDALDSASRDSGVFGSFASFLGGKGSALRRLEEMGFENTFVLEGYVCRGGNVRFIKRFDSDWQVFAENDAATGFIKVGTQKNRPTYQEVDFMLEEQGISLKYARDMGLAPKL